MAANRLKKIEYINPNSPQINLWANLFEETFNNSISAKPSFYLANNLLLLDYRYKFHCLRMNIQQTEGETEQIKILLNCSTIYFKLQLCEKKKVVRIIFVHKINDLEGLRKS
jgi:hypothetical protein